MTLLSLIAAAGVYLLGCLACWSVQWKNETVYGYSRYRVPWSLALSVSWRHFTWGVVVFTEMWDIHLGFLTMMVSYDRVVAKRRKAERKAVRELCAILGPRECEGVE